MAPEIGAQALSFFPNFLPLTVVKVWAGFAQQLDKNEPLNQESYL